MHCERILKTSDPTRGFGLRDHTHIGSLLKTSCLSSLLVLSLTLLTMAQSGDGYDLSRNTIDGGGVMNSTGGAFELSGTIGQPDAGVMTGDEFELTGGFWFGLSPPDCNDDGLVSLLDHETFAVCLLGPSGGITASPCSCFDVDGDENVTLSDYAQLQAGFTGQ